MSTIHFYNSDNGVLTHGTRFNEDLGGEITVTGPVEQLVGWPTPAMRRAVGGNGDEMAWYVGTDEQGNIVKIGEPSMQRTTIEPYRNVILTAGMRDHRGNQLIGVFESEEDVRSERADELAIATLDPKVLSAEQLRIARENSDSLV